MTCALSPSAGSAVRHSGQSLLFFNHPNTPSQASSPAVEAPLELQARRDVIVINDRQTGSCRSVRCGCIHESRVVNHSLGKITSSIPSSLALFLPGSHHFVILIVVLLSVGAAQLLQGDEGRNRDRVAVAVLPAYTPPTDAATDTRGRRGSSSSRGGC